MQPSLQTIVQSVEDDRFGAIAALEARAKAAPNDIETLAALCTAYLRCLDFERTERTARQLLGVAPDHPVGLRGLTFSLPMLGDAAGEMDAWLRMRARGSSLAMLAVPTLQHRRGALSDAREGFEAYLAAQTTAEGQAVALNGLMRLARDQRRFGEANLLAVRLGRIYRASPVTAPSMVMARNQDLSHPRWFQLCDKAYLADVLESGAIADPPSRFPATFQLPRDAAKLAAYATREPDAIYIAKPTHGSGGQGIELTDDPAAYAGRRDYILQRYIERPMLARGNKGHIRAYVLVTSAAPLRAYLFREGLLRIAPEPFDLASPRRFDPAMHITNTALHHGDPRLVISSDPRAEDQGHLWTLGGYLRHIEAGGGDVQAIRANLKSLTEWFLRAVSRDGRFAEQAAGPPRAYAAKLFGLDIVLDQDGAPWLIEMQAVPGTVGSPLVNRVSADMYRAIAAMTVFPCVGDTAEAVSDQERFWEERDQQRFQPLDLGGV